MHSIFFELTALFILSGAIAFGISLLKQPSIIAYLLTGLIIGPLGYYRISQGDIFQGLGEVGITLLLFMVGLELDISQLKRIGKAALLAGIGQITITALLAYFTCTAFGLSFTPSLYIALAVTFSSTIIVVKLLNEKQDLQSLYGKLTVGILLVQDFAAIILLIFLAGTKNLSFTNAFDFFEPALWSNILFTLLKGLILGLIIYWHSKHLLPKILKFISKSEELVLLFSLAWALGLAALVSLPAIGFNLEIGGFVAGLALAGSSTQYQIAGRIKSLRDFFIIIFFIILGSQLNLSHVSNFLPIALTLSLFVLIGKPLITAILLGFLGYKPRTALFTGISLSQISEFSLILLALGANLGHVGSNESAVITIVALITIALSSYGTLYAAVIFNWLKRPLHLVIAGTGSSEKSDKTDELKKHIIVIGAHRLGRQIIHALEKQTDPFLIVDFNPDVIAHYQEKHFHTLYGDISDPEIQDIARIKHAKLIISTIPDVNDNLTLIDTLKHQNKSASLILTAHDETDALYLYEKGADYVIVPHIIGGLHVARFFSKTGLKDLKSLREHHLKMLTQHHAI